MAVVTDTTINAAATTTAPSVVDAVGEARAERTFSISIAISAVRCTLTYVLIPWIFPVLGETTGVGPTLGVVIGVAAIVANVFSIRRFHRSNHRWKWQMTFINSVVIILLMFLVAQDLPALIG